MEVSWDPQVEYRRMENVVSEPSKPPANRSEIGPFGNGPGDGAPRLKTDSPFSNHEGVASLSEPKLTFRRGADFARLLSSKPDLIIDELGEKVVTRIGEVSCKDADAKRAFGHKDMITRGLNSLKEPNHEQGWKNYVTKKTRCGFSSEHHRLGEPVTLAVYAVDIEKAADPLDEGVLTPLLKTVDEGPASVDIWDIPAVRAIVEYKWHSWARKYLLIEFALYMAWLISFLGFLVLYIQHDLKHGFVKGQTTKSTLWLLSIIFDVCAVGFMLPFIVIEINSVVYYKWKWLQMWNIIDCFAYILQVIIITNHLIGFQMNGHAYKTILSIQCSILFIKVQYFFRVVGVGASYIETLSAVLYDVRYFIAFIITTTISASLSFAVLYSEHDKTDKLDENDIGARDFGTVPKSLVTTYAVLLGSFDPAYVFHTHNMLIKGISFLAFQVSMSILVLNLLIAMVTNSYSHTMAKKRALYNKGRAQLIGELEVSLPNYFRSELAPYIHFAVITKRRYKEFELSALKTLPPLSQSTSNDDVYSKLKSIETLMTDLNSKLDTLQNQVSRLEGEKALEEDALEGS